jgi:hypothetical protein
MSAVALLRERERHRRARHPRQYSDDDLAVFAQYIEQRALCRPQQCFNGQFCWVLLGPRGISRDGLCLACNRAPRPLPTDHQSYTAYSPRFFK